MKYNRYLKIILMILLLVFVVWKIDLGQTFLVLRKTNGFLFGIAVIGIIPLYLLKTFRFKYILSANGVNYSIKDALMVFFISNFVGFITPARLGEFVKAYYIRMDCGLKTSRSLSIVILDRLFDLGVLLVFALLAIFYMPVSQKAKLILFLSGLALIICAAVLFFHLHLVKNLKFVKDTKWFAIIDDLLIGFELRLSQVLYGTLLTVLAYFVLFIQCYYLAKSIQVFLSFITICSIISLVSLFALLPISISGIGTREAAMIFFFSGLNLSSEAAVAFSFLNFILFNIIGGLSGGILWFFKPISLKQLNFEVIKNRKDEID